MADSPEAGGSVDLHTVDSQVWDAEPVAPSTPDPVVSPVVEGQPAAPVKERNDKGQFAAKSQPDTPAPSEPETPPSAPADEPTAPETPVVEGEPAAEEPEAVYPEFEYTVSGRPLNIPGSKVGEDGVFIPKAHQDQITRLLIAGRMLPQREREHQKAVQAARAEGQGEVEKAKRVMAAFGELTKDKAKLLEWAENLDRNRELLMTRAELEAVKAEAKTATSTLTEQQQSRAAQDLVPQLQSGLKSIIATLGKKAEYAGVDADKLYERLMHRHFDQVFSEDENGEILLDEGFIADEMGYEIAAVSRGRTAAAEEAARIAKAAKENAARQGQGGQKPPPMAGVGSGGKPATPKTKPYKTTREADTDIWG